MSSPNLATIISPNGFSINTDIDLLRGTYFLNLEEKKALGAFQPSTHSLDVTAETKKCRV